MLGTPSDGKTHLGSRTPQCGKVVPAVKAGGELFDHKAGFFGPRGRYLLWSHKRGCGVLGVSSSPFFPGILLSRKPPASQEKRLVFEKNDG